MTGGGCENLGGVRADASPARPGAGLLSRLQWSGRAAEGGRASYPPAESVPGTGGAAAAATRREGRRRWTINGDFLALQPTGVARYAREVTLALDGLLAERHPLADGLEVTIVAPTAGARPLALRALKLEIVPEFRRPRLPQVWVQVQLPRHVRGGLLSFCNLAPISVRRQIVCIHDLHTRLLPESYGRAFRLAHDVVLPILGRRAAHITTVSSFSRDHLVNAGIAPPEKITVTYNGSGHTARWDAGRATLPPPDRPYALALGRAQKHKSPELLLRLAPLLDDLGLDLWLAGDVDEGFVDRHLPARPPNLHLLGHIGDDDLKRALLGAVCFLFPSRMEGFGLPAAEAMACDCPVICSPLPCLPEICGSAALYADPDDPKAWADQVARLAEDEILRAQQIRAGRDRIRLYSWRRIAEQYLDLMAQVA